MEKGRRRSLNKWNRRIREQRLSQGRRRLWKMSERRRDSRQMLAKWKRRRKSKLSRKLCIWERRDGVAFESATDDDVGCGLSLLAAGAYSSREGAKFGFKQLEKYLGQPFDSETSRGVLKPQSAGANI